MSRLKLTVPADGANGIISNSKKVLGFEFSIEHRVCDNDIDPKTSFEIKQEGKNVSMIRLFYTDELLIVRDFINDILKKEGVC
jgi:hypothetical protein